MIRYRAAILAALVLLAPTATLANEFRVQLERAVEDIQDVVDGKSLRLGDFVVSGGIEGSSAIKNHLRLELTEMLAKHSISTTVARADFELTGKVRLLGPERSDGPIRLSLILEDSAEGEEKLERRVTVEGTTELLVAAGINAGGLAAPKAELRKKIDAALRTPPEKRPDFVTAGELRAGGFAMRIKTRSKEGAYRAKPIQSRTRGRNAFVPLAKDDTYSVELINDAAHDVAVFLRVDGIDVFHFAEAIRGQAILVPKNSSVEIPGWAFTSKETREFKVTEVPQSVAVRLGRRTEQLATITAVFHAAWKTNAERPRDEPAAGVKGAGLATGLGSRVEKNYVPAKRFVGVPRATLTVHYDAKFD